jgi:acyl-CoA thioesterase
MQELQAAEHMLRQDPLVQQMMQAFGGTIVSGSLQAISPAAI